MGLNARPFIQIAVDTCDKSELDFRLKSTYEAGFRRIEIGTSTLLKFGECALTEARSAGHDYIYADTKLIDFSAEVVKSLSHVVNAITLHCLAGEQEISQILEVARSYQIDIFVTSIGLSSNRALATIQKLSHIPVAGFILHGSGSPQEAREKLTSLIDKQIQNNLNVPSVYAGGIRPLDIRSLLNSNTSCVPKGLIMGRSAFRNGGLASLSEYCDGLSLEGTKFA